MYDVDLIIKSDPRFWRPKQHLLELCLSQADTNHTISAEALNGILQLVAPSASPSPDDLRRIEKVLSRLNSMGVVDAVVPAIPEKKHRESILPINTTRRSFSQLDAVSGMVEHLWKSWPYQTLGESPSSQRLHRAMAFLFATSCASDGAFGARIISNMMLFLKVQDIMVDGTVLTRIYPNARVNQSFPLTLPSSARLILLCLRKKQRNRKPDEYVFFASEENLDDRRKRIKREMQASYRSLKNDFDSMHPEADSPKTWNDFQALARFLPVMHGLEPYLASVLKDYPLPACHPMESNFNIIRGDGIQSPSGLITLKISKKLLPNTGLEIPDLNKTDRINQAIESDWTGKSKRILRRLIYRAKCLAPEKTSSERVIHDLCVFIDQLLNEADQIAPETSALHWALLWIKAHIQKTNAVVHRTIQDYLSRAFINGLLNDPESIDMSNWETEDHEQAYEDVLSRASLKQPASRKNIEAVYKLAYTFGTEHGFCEGVSLTSLSKEWVGGTSRRELIGLGEFDTFIHKLIELNQRDALEIAACCILAFHGGMRASEISTLTLNDLVACDEHLYIHIRKGKSAAARRIIPLHLLAPHPMCSVIAGLIHERRNEFPSNAHLRKIPLFGPKGKRERYASRTLADASIQLLKQTFGDAITLHHLRHCFASWLFLRMYAGKYPDLIPELTESGHEVFSNRYLKRVIFLMSGEISDRMPEHAGTGIVRLTKLMGHLGPRVTFSTYIHTFHIVQAHAMRRLSDIHGTRKLPGKTIALLVPKMKTRHSQAKLKDKSINGILNLNRPGFVVG